MLSIKYIRENIDFVKQCLLNKNSDIDLDIILNIDLKRRTIIKEVEALKSLRNSVTKEISEKKKNKEDATSYIKKMKDVSFEIKDLDNELHKILKELNDNLLIIPNIIHESVPVGDNANDNLVIREWGEKPSYDFKIKSHLELCESLKMVDFKRAVKMSGSAFPLYVGNGAKLERSIINYMLDYHIENNGYIELFPPFLTTREATQTSGQLPKFEDEMYHLDKDDMFCISTSEIPVTNYFKNEVLNESDLPQSFVAYSACFRREAGSYGKDVKGLHRLHQFNKVELVKFVNSQESYDELEQLVNHAEVILQNLGLHYRVVSLCSGDLSFSAAKCYDIEVWSPYEEKYLEVSSCSNFESFQSNRGNMKYRNNEGKLNLMHTLNGSALATPRLIISLLETCQQRDGSINLPLPLKSYFGATKIK